MTFTYQKYLLLVFCIFISFFMFGGFDVVNAFRLIAGIWGTPDFIKYPIILFFLVLTWLAWTDYKRQ